MRKAQKEQALSFVKTLGLAHDSLKKLMENKSNKNAHVPAQEILEDCQQGAIELGNMIESSEGEGFVTIPLLEDYCELTYQIHLQLENQKIVNANNAYKSLRKSLIRIENSIKNDIKVKIEIVFLPYKVSMWDSLESVWMAAEADENCDAYVVPIPYYERNADRTLGTFHYEGNDFPSYVPITHYEEYRLEERMPDVIYIHNPYDNLNYVTSVDPRFYSSELKKYTDCLVYIPYYTTSGGMSEGQAQCLAYYFADYIVIQSEKYRKFFDPDLPDEKFLPLGSPKFDRVVRICNNPPEPPKSWKNKMTASDGRRKRVYFYNTSINGMLGGTETFLKKMEYVFRCFLGREDACLLWRPHPLLESTLDSMRKEFRPVYDQLKKYFIENEIGIYDDTPDIENTIALCDAYIGDAATSVTSLFGIAGKPLFILNNNINTLPKEDDWRGEYIKGFFPDGHDEWMVTQGNKLYHAKNHDYKYEYYCDLSKFSAGDYYSRAMEIDGKVYACPYSAQDILVINHSKIEKRILLEHKLEREGAFAGAWEIGGNLFLIPYHYPAIVKYDTTEDKTVYIEGYNDVFINFVGGEWRIGGICVWNHCLVMASPTDDRVLLINADTDEIKILHTGAKNVCGCLGIIPVERFGMSGDDIWLLPYTGKIIACWNPTTGTIREYTNMPSDFTCKNYPHGHECEDRPFSELVLTKDYVYLSPYWGNMLLRLNKKTGEFCEWKFPMEILGERKNGYYDAGLMGIFLHREDGISEYSDRFFSYNEKKMYGINFGTGQWKEIEIQFDPDELKSHEPGFCEESDWLFYACKENVFNTLAKFIDGNTVGNQFEKERQLHAFEKIAANYDGTSGEKIHRFVCERNTGGKEL